MIAVRRLLAQRWLAALLCAATLLLKLLVPTGFMISADGGGLAITLCPGVATGAPTDMPGMQAAMPDHGRKDGAKPDMPCAFASLAAQAIGTADPVLLLALIGFVLALGVRPQRLLPTFAPLYLRPPLRGPPALP